MPNNGKTYTEVLIDIYDKLDNVEQRVIKRIDVITVDNAECKEKMARGEVKFAALADKLDGKGGVNERIETNAADIKTNENSIVKVRNLNATITAGLSTIAAFIGLQK